MKDDLRNRLVKDIDRLANELIIDPDKITAFVKTWTGGFHQYSWGNLMLILWQKPEATICAGYKQWQNHGRFVNKGEKGLAILAPWRKKIAKELEDGTVDEALVLRFYPVHVFDVSQTEGEPLNIGHAEMVKGSTELTLKEIAALFPYPLVINNGLESGSTDGKTIKVSERGNELANIATYMHELAHCELKHIDSPLSKGERELEAEATAFLVCSVLGIENESSKLYIANWGGNPAELTRHGSRVIRTAEKISRKILGK